MTAEPDRAHWRDTLHEVIFEADTPAGKAFDVALLLCIVLSVLAVSLESVETIEASHGRLLRVAEWTITIEDPLPIPGGSPGIVGYAPSVIHYDNITVQPNG